MSDQSPPQRLSSCASVGRVPVLLDCLRGVVAAPRSRSWSNRCLLNIAPVAVDDAYITDEATTVFRDAPGLLLNDSDADGDPLTVTGVNISAPRASWRLFPTAVSATGRTSSSSTWASGNRTPISFQYTISDGHGGVPRPR